MGLDKILKALPLVGSAFSIGESIFNGLSQGKTNRDNRNFSREMYDRQRKDALTDTAMQNEYNSPAATMARLKAAGLNPNLAYGSGATTTSAPVRSSSVEGAQATAPKIDTSGIGSGLMAMYDILKKQAETNNLNAAANVAKEEAANKIVERARINSSQQLINTQNEQAKFKLGQDRTLNENTIEAARLSNLKLKADTKYTLDNNERAALLATSSIAKSTAEILTMQAERTMIPYKKQHILAEIKRLQQSGLLDEMEAILRNNGGSWHDNYAMRIIPFLKSKIDPAGINKGETAQPMKLEGAVRGIIRELRRRK